MSNSKWHINILYVKEIIISMDSHNSWVILARNHKRKNKIYNIYCDIIECHFPTIYSKNQQIEIRPKNRTFMLVLSFLAAKEEKSIMNLNMDNIQCYQAEILDINEFLETRIEFLNEYFIEKSSEITDEEKHIIKQCKLALERKGDIDQKILEKMFFFSKKHFFNIKD